MDFSCPVWQEKFFHHMHIFPGTLFQNCVACIRSGPYVLEKTTLKYWGVSLVFPRFFLAQWGWRPADACEATPWNIQLSLVFSRFFQAWLVACWTSLKICQSVVEEGTPIEEKSCFEYVRIPTMLWMFALIFTLAVVAFTAVWIMMQRI